MGKPGICSSYSSSCFFCFIIIFACTFICCSTWYMGILGNIWIVRKSSKRICDYITSTPMVIDRNKRFGWFPWS
ncbi:hypothetical protein RchiOBHm_Chr2g0157251 [Rosa chinensis]|uniref:Uncharacterized protein n=1 Tax=Rosa chinensis TaxID=74649 RepID=A0A2P6S1P4_ROSCH|nr:hypothetical protein RchiOBHm_Chr2g0157251 [Rosa chinensis]